MIGYKDHNDYMRNRVREEPKRPCCEKCGERLRSPAFHGCDGSVLCGLCFDDERNKERHAHEH